MEYKKIFYNFTVIVFFVSFINAGVNYNNKNKNTLNNVVKSKNYQYTKSSSSGKFTVSNPDSPGNNRLNSIKNYLDQAKTISKNYRSHIILFSLLGSYGTVHYLLYSGNNYLKRETLWSSWPLNRSIQSLLEIPQEKLAILLLDEIKQRYNGHTNFMHALTKFKEVINKEKSKLLFYDKLYTFLEKYCLLSIFPIQVKSFTTIKERLERIAYLKNVFFTWSHTIPMKALEDVKKNDSSSDKISEDDKVNIQINNEFSPNTLNYLSNANVQYAIVKCINTIGELPGRISDSVKYYTQTTKQFYIKNQKYIISGALLSSYFAILLKLQQGNQYIENLSLWSHWKKDKNLHELTQLPRQELIYDLIVEIQKRHIDTHNPVDFITPLSLFMQEFEKEKSNLLCYSKLYNFLKKSYLLYMFPVETDNYFKIQAHLGRLSFIRDTFLNWIAEYKIEQNSGFLEK